MNPMEATKMAAAGRLQPPQGGSATANWLEHMSDCPHCGAPIYGKKAVTICDELAPVRYSCECRTNVLRVTPKPQ